MPEPWTSEDIPDQRDRVAIVTGANSGLGYETARALARKGASVVMACRSAERGSRAAEVIRNETPAAEIEVVPLDLADLASVRQFAEECRGSHKRLDLLVNNAGVMAIPRRETTADGFERHFGTNYLGHFALTGLLLDRLLDTANARIVSVSSVFHHVGRIRLDDLQAERSYGRWRAYAQSKLAVLLFTYELQRRLQASGADVLALAAHPGWANTQLQRYLPLVPSLNPLFGQRPDMGALPLLYAATAPDVVGGDYYGPDGFLEFRGSPEKARSSRRSQDSVVARELWFSSEALTGVRYSRLLG